MIYTFRCSKCGRVVQLDHGFDEPHPITHRKLAGAESCGGNLVRIFDVPNIIFRGSGWYCKDKVLYEPTEDDLYQ
jgi:predicted nucleic acid-binding Zn ribbon protein